MGDPASHDGRYSFAALKAGAAHVTGVEVRESLVHKAQETFAFYGQDPETYRFVRGDVFEVLKLMYRLHDLAPQQRRPESLLGGRVLVLRPSVPALRMLLAAYGFEIESMYDWKSRLAGRPPVSGLAGYAKGKHVTLRCRSREAAIASGGGRSLLPRSQRAHDAGQSGPNGLVRRLPSSPPVGGASGSTGR